MQTQRQEHTVAELSLAAIEPRDDWRLTAQDIDLYRVNGFTIVPGFLGDAECDLVMALMRACADEKFSALMNPDRVDFLARYARQPAGLAFDEVARFMRSILVAPRTILETFQGRPVVGLMSQLLFKQAGSPYASQAWNPHQDNAYPQNVNKQYITTNIFMEDADLENGTLYVFPGSHAEPLLPVMPTVSYREAPGTNPGNTVEIPSRYRQMDVHFKKGDLLVLNGNTIHGSYPNRSPSRSRPLYSCSYISAGEEFVAGATAQRVAISLRD